MIALDQFRAEGSSAVALGFFDGVHLGHQAILSQAQVAFTFSNHPDTVLRPREAQPLITAFYERAALIEALGPQVVYVEFTRDFSQLSAGTFIQEILRDRLRATRVVVGGNYRFGHRAAGDIATLQRSGLFAVEVVPPVELKGELVSSTRIRGLIGEGDVAAAARLMGRPYFLQGPVLQGERRGRQLGTPTANLALPEGKVVPAFGVYAVRADGHAGVANLGVRPTFGGGQPLLEVHLLDYDGDLYGHPLKVAFVDRIRGEQRFPGLDALREQIQRDIQEARRRLA